MTAEEQAKELVNEFLSIPNVAFNVLKDPIANNIAKRCAIICINRELDALIRMRDQDLLDYHSYFDEEISKALSIKMELQKL